MVFIRTFPLWLFRLPSINDLSAYIKRRIGSDHEYSEDKNKLDISSKLEPYGIREASLVLYSNIADVRGGERKSLDQGMAESLDYNFICHHSNADCIISIPSSRWDPDPDHSRRLHRHFGNLLTTIDDFDSEYFRCQRAEAELMDPQQRLLLHRCTLPAIDIRSNDTKCGVFVAISHIDYAIELCSLRRPLSPYMATGSANSVACGRMSYTFGLTGPCASVDTACSSALVGCHFLNGCILHENLDYGIAAAMNLCMSQERYMIFYVAGMLSKEGRCKTLDAAADGYVRMESAAPWR